MLAFQYNNLSSAELRAVRAGLLNVKVPEGMERFEMTVARSGIVGAACKKRSFVFFSCRCLRSLFSFFSVLSTSRSQAFPLTTNQHPTFAPQPDDPLSSFRSLLSGPMLLLHSSSPLTPSYLSSIFSQIDKTTAFRLSPGLTKAPQPFHSTSALTSPTEASATVVNPKIFCVGGMVDGHVVGLDAIRTIGTLPSLKELQSQLVGLIGSPAAQIAAVLGMASGGQLSRVLESLKVKLEEEQGGKAA